MAKTDVSPFIDIAAALQCLIEVVQENEERMTPDRFKALNRARSYRSQLLAWVHAAREVGRT
jgi:hypothetical protein